MYVYLSGCASACGNALALYLEVFAEHHDAFIPTRYEFLYINSLPALHHSGRGSVSQCALSRLGSASASPSYGPVLILELFPKPNPKS